MEQQSAVFQLAQWIFGISALLGGADLAQSGGGWSMEALELLNCLVSGTLVFIIQSFLPVP